MRRFVEDTPNLYMVDHHAFIVDDRVQRHLLSRDGLHLSPDGIRTMLQDILDSVDTLRLSYIDSDAVYDSPVKPLPEPPLPPALVPEDWPLLPAPATSLVTYPAAASAAVTRPPVSPAAVSRPPVSPAAATRPPVSSARGGNINAHMPVYEKFQLSFSGSKTRKNMTSQRGASSDDHFHIRVKNRFSPLSTLPCSNDQLSFTDSNGEGKSTRETKAKLSTSQKTNKKSKCNEAKLNVAKHVMHTSYFSDNQIEESTLVTTSVAQCHYPKVKLDNHVCDALYFSDCTVEERCVTEEKEQHNDAFISDAVPESCDFKQEGGGSTVPIVTDQHGMLTTKQVLTIFESVNTENIITVPPTAPKAGEVYLFKAFSDSTENDWKCDGYRWVNCSNKKFPKKDPLWIKYYFNVYDKKSQNGSNAFTKKVYQLLVDKKLTILHYMGDENECEHHPHGNSKNSTIPFKRTCPSVLKKIKDNVASGFSVRTGNLYKENTVMPIKNTKHQGILNARNLKQVQNAKANVTKSKRLSRDDLYNALELSYHLEGFTHQIDIYPDLVVIVGLLCLLIFKISHLFNCSF